MDEEHVLSTDVRLALIFYAPTSKNLSVKEYFERAYYVCFVRYLFFFFFLLLFFFFSKWLKPLFWVKI